MVTPFRPPSASVLLDGQPVKTFHSPDGWALVGLTLYYGSVQTGQIQVGFNSNACPNGGTYFPFLYDPARGYVGRWARAEGCWSGNWFPTASSVDSAWGRWYAPPSPVGPIYETVYSFYLRYVPSAIAANGSDVSGPLGVEPYEVLYSSMSARDAAIARHTTTMLGLLVCDPDTQLQCGPSLKTANPCCIDCATLAARYQGLTAAIQSAASFTKAKADELIAQAAENRKNPS